MQKDSFQEKQFEDELKTMPKVDLHCHMDGSIPIGTMRKMADHIGMELPEDEELIKRLQVSHDCRDLNEYLSCFDIPLSLLQASVNYREMAAGVLEEVKKENTAYIEQRFSPLSSFPYGLNYRDIIEDALEGMKEGIRKSGVQSTLIVCGMRHLPPEENIKMLRIAREYLGEGVAACDMAGSEADFPIMTQAAFFEEARKLDFPFTIHAGECGSPKSVADAIALGASRIGHGIAAYKDRDVMDLCRRKQIPLEFCPVSNLQSRAVPDISQYPFELFRREGLFVTVNTDNRTVSSTSLTDEFMLLHETYGISIGDCRELTEKALQAAFADDAIKHIVWKKIKGV